MTINWHHMELIVQFIVVVCGIIIAALVALEWLLWRHARYAARKRTREAAHTLRELEPYNHVIVQQTGDGDFRLRPITGFTKPPSDPGRPTSPS